METRLIEFIRGSMQSEIFDSRLRELNMGVLETRNIDSLTEEEENWRRQLVNGTVDGRIPEGESIGCFK